MVGALGLGALVPTSVMLAAGSITVTDAALRACATLVAAVVVGRVADRSLAHLILAYEQAQEDAGEPQGTTDETIATDSPRRRATDR